MGNNNPNIQNEDYYSKKSNKVIDFLIGYFGFFFISAVLYYFMFFAGLSGAITSSFSGLFGIIMIMIPIIALLVANVGLRKSRRYIARGINFALLTLVLIPVLFFGACLITLGGWGK